MCIYLRCVERAVAEELLDGSELCTAVEHVGGEGVAEHMGAFSGSMHSGEFHGRMDDVLDLLPVERTTVGATEEFVGRAGVEKFVAQAAVAGNHIAEFGAERHYSVFITLSVHF